MTNPKRHHYVPRFVLENFVDDAGKLWVRRVSNDAVWSGTPEDVYVERHRYSLIDENGKRDAALEKTYAVLEGTTKPIIDKLLAAARSNESPQLSSAEKAVWDEFLYHQMKRVPAVTEKLAERKSWEERLEGVISKLLAQGLSVDDATLAEIRSKEGLARIKQNAIVNALGADSPLIRMLLGTSSLEVGIAPQGEAFVIGSRPIAGSGAGLQSAVDGSPTMWFPIASDVAVRPIFGCASKAAILTSSAIAQINGVSLRQSDFLVGYSKELVKSIRQT